ncbi:MAG: adenylate/guanylate cyclase domain-containing protein, partial [Thermoplasmata archaeon]
MLDLADQLLPVIEEFLTGAKPSTTSDRILATVLFVDIVDSTGRVRALGDSNWKQLLEQANNLSQRAISSFRGRKVKSTGDGLLAVFDGPTRAIQCAREIRESLRALQLPIRAGLHTGECEALGDDVTGFAVHLA